MWMNEQIHWLTNYTNKENTFHNIATFQYTTMPIHISRISRIVATNINIHW